MTEPQDRRSPAQKGTHRRNTKPMLDSPRCGAKTRKGTPCRAPAVAGKSRCRMHGGAKGSGAPPGNQNALKTGLHTKEAKAFRDHVMKILSDGKRMLSEMDD